MVGFSAAVAGGPAVPGSAQTSGVCVCVCVGGR